MEPDLLAVNLNLDAVLALQALTGIDGYPAVLAVLPNIYNLDDDARVRAVVLERLAEAGVVADGVVHPRVARWLEALYRPDVEMAARVVDFDPHDWRPRGMLRIALVRSGEMHVLATRCDDEIVIQEVFTAGRPISTVAGAVGSAFGPAKPVRFDSFTVRSEELVEFGDASNHELSGGLVELGADPVAARLMMRAFGKLLRKAEILMIEHHDGRSVQTDVGVGVFETSVGRVVAAPSVGLDGQAWTTFTPGDDAALEAGIKGLVELLPGRSWTETVR